MNSYSQIDVEMSAAALKLATAGAGLVSPNPLVGCIITSADGEIVGSGTYKKGELVHAEAIALERAGPRAAGGTAYVSLEPHSHFGKTPPCTEALINAGIRRVVCPIEDPNPLVSGKGFERLRSAGVEVITGVLASDAAKVNEKFICWHKERRPFVHLKLAMSLDGRISLNSSVSTALSGEAARQRVHELRHEYDAILVGGNTASVDDPSLTDRSGKPRYRPLMRVVLDDRLRLEPSSVLASTTAEAPTVVFTNSVDTEKISLLRSAGVEVIASEAGARDLPGVLNELYARDIQSVLVEGGSTVAGAFIDAGLVDKVTFIFAPLIIGGSAAPVAVGGTGVDSLCRVLELSDITVTSLGSDIDVTGYPIHKQQ